MDEAIKTFPQQFTWEPVLNGGEKLPASDKYIVCGMGGSHLAAGLLKMARPKLDLLIHRDYGLPRVPDYFLQGSLIILSSFSGNTEEVLDTGRVALAQGLKLVVMSTGGRLLDWAKVNQLPYIQFPNSVGNIRLEPRAAIGYSLKALVKIVGSDSDLLELTGLSGSLQPENLETAGQELARKIQGKIPLIYAASPHFPLAYNWKIKFNETAKVPAFYNVLPEVNHNEMSGFDGQFSRQEWDQRFIALFLIKPLADGLRSVDLDNDPRIAKRFQILAELYRDRGLAVEEVVLTGASIWEMAFNTLLLAEWAAYYLAKLNGDDPNGQTPLIDEFKKQMAVN